MSLRSTGRLVLVGVGVMVGLVVLGNLAILSASWWANRTTGAVGVPELAGVKNVEAVDATLWRGAAPTEEGYRALAARGVRVVVDLRAEEGVEADEELVRSLGMKTVRLPVRDGQVPSSEQVKEFLRVSGDVDGLTFVHCGAGVGRTGAMAGAYLVAKGQISGRDALWRNLAVGPPSLEQVSFVGRMGDRVAKPPALVVAVSRVLDAPRRIAHNFGL